MRRLVFVGLLVVTSACGRACGSSSHPMADASTPSDAAVAIVDASAPAREASAADASVAITPEQRKAYSHALAEGRKLTVEKKYDAAAEAFTRALTAIPEDPHALAERGYARYLKGDLDRAKDDLDFASALTDPRDHKLAAQIEYNLGLVCDGLADTGQDAQLRGAAVGHYRRSNELSPSKAAAAKMGGCPASWGPVEIETFASAKVAEAKITGTWEPLGTGGVLASNQSEAGGTDLLLPLDAGRFAHVEVGSTAQWNCGTLGDVDATKVGDVWKVEYQAHRGAMSPGICTCGDDICDDGSHVSPDAPPCKCDSPLCPMVCGGADLPAGDHIEVYVDARSGAGLWRVQVAYDYMTDAALDVDLATRRFHATGLGCIADLPIGKK